VTLLATIRRGNAIEENKMEDHQTWVILANIIPEGHLVTSVPPYVGAEYWTGYSWTTDRRNAMRFDTEDELNEYIKQRFADSEVQADQ
jgi:hypothetical protein